MHQLRLVRDLGPEMAYIAAGFVRNRVWDALYDQPALQTPSDVDVVYFDRDRASKESDLNAEALLTTHDASAEWQVRNQAYMHHHGGHAPFASLDDALMHWAETATSIGARLDDDEKLHFVAPFGFEDLLTHVLRITPIMKRTNPDGFYERLEKKRWQERWPDLRVIQ